MRAVRQTRVPRRIPRIIPGLVLAALAAVAMLPRPGSATVGKSTVLQLRIQAPSLGEDSRNVRVYLPPSYSVPDSSRHRYPVIYMLHGWPGSEGNLLSYAHADAMADSLIARHLIPEIIMVFPNGSGAGLFGRSYWINSFDGTKRVADFVTKDIVGWVDAHYRTIAAASGRGIIGISEGADAAFNLTFKHPDVFSACGGHSGDYILTKGVGTGGFLGPEPGASRILAENSAALYARSIVPQLRQTRIYFDTGTSDESLEHNRALHRTLDSLGVVHEYHEFPGSHTWGYWRAHLRESLIAVAGALK